MAEGMRVDEMPTTWGRAEHAAFDRCVLVGFRPRPPAAPAPLSRFSRTIETEIIPRLFLAHRASPDTTSPDEAHQPTSADVIELARLTIGCDLPGAQDYVQSLRAKGASLEIILLGLLAPTARLLGDMWRDDLCSFADVTIGLSGLHQLLRSLGSAFEASGVDATCGRILLAPMPGEQHDFGVALLTTFFRRAGWEVAGGWAHTQADIVEAARKEWLDVVGLSLSGDILFERVRPLIKAVRRSSRNQSLLVIVGGRFFLDNPDRVAETGADFGASDAPDALRQASRSLALMPSRP